MLFKGVAGYLEWRAAAAGASFPNQSRYRVSVALALVPPFLAGSVAFGWRTPALAGTACLAAFASAAAAKLLSPESSKGWRWAWLTTGLLVGAMLPPHAPLWLAVICGAVAVLAGHMLFGRKGYCWLPPSAVGLLAAHLLLPSLMASGEWPVLRSYASGAVLSFEGADVSKAVSRQTYFETLAVGRIPPDPAVLQLAPQAALRAPYREDAESDGGEAKRRGFDLVQVLSGYTSGTCAGTSGLAWIAAAFLLILTGSALRSPAAAGAVVFGAGMLVVASAQAHDFADGLSQTAVHMLASGFPAALLCWTADPAVAAVRPKAQVAAGAIFGLLAVAQRTVLPPVEDLAFASVTAAALTPLLDRFWPPQQQVPGPAPTHGPAPEPEPASAPEPVPTPKPAPQALEASPTAAGEGHGRRGRNGKAAEGPGLAEDSMDTPPEARPDGANPKEGA